MIKVAIVVFFFLFFAGCGKDDMRSSSLGTSECPMNLGKSVVTAEMRIGGESVCDACVVDRSHVVCRIGKKICYVDIVGGTLKNIATTEGEGPDAVMNPSRLKFRRGKVWANSITVPFMYEISIQDPLSVKRIKLPGIADDWVWGEADDGLVIANVYWEKKIAKKITDPSLDCEPFGDSPSLSPIMMKFNVCQAVMAVEGKFIYVAQSNLPKVDVYNLDSLKKVEEIDVSYSAYVPMPEKYDIDKYDSDAHSKWMAGWLSIYRLFVDKGNVLVVYKRGYESDYQLLLVNSKRSKKYVSGDIKYSVYSYRAESDTIHNIRAFCDDEEKVIWQDVDIKI